MFSDLTVCADAREQGYSDRRKAGIEAQARYTFCVIEWFCLVRVFLMVWLSFLFQFLRYIAFSCCYLS